MQQLETMDSNSSSDPDENQTQTNEVSDCTDLQENETTEPNTTLIENTQTPPVIPARRITKASKIPRAFAYLADHNIIPRITEEIFLEDHSKNKFKTAMEEEITKWKLLRTKANPGFPQGGFVRKK